MYDRIREADKIQSMKNLHVPRALRIIVFWITGFVDKEVIYA